MLQIDAPATSWRSPLAAPSSTGGREPESSDSLRRLTAEQREVLELRFVRGYSIAETQAVTGRSEESVKKLQARALQRLRDWLPAVERSRPRSSQQCCSG